MKVFHPRIFCHIAREAPVAVVLRRGPSKWTQMLRWNLTDDTVEPGQWLHGRVYERRCDLSPDGKYLVYFAMNGKWHSETKGSWTAISKPPFFSALVLWPKGDCWNGGGFFVDSRHLFLYQQIVTPLHDVGEGYKKHFQLLARHPLGDIGVGECLSSYFPLMKQEGWTLKEEAKTDAASSWTWTRPSPTLSGLKLVRNVFASSNDAFRAGRACYFDEYQILKPADTIPESLKGVDWANWDHRGRLLFSRRGQLFARSFKDTERFEDLSIVDLSSMKPEPVMPAPSAIHW